METHTTRRSGGGENGAGRPAAVRKRGKPGRHAAGRTRLRLEAREILSKLTRAVLHLAREPKSGKLGKKLFPTKQAVFDKAKEDGLVGEGPNSVRDELWNRLADRFRLSLDPPSARAEAVATHFRIGEIRVAPTESAMADEAARLHVQLVPPAATCFYSCGQTLADTARAAAASGLYGRDFTACSAVVLATDSANALPPSAITAEFQRYGQNARTLAYQFPLLLQSVLAPSTHQGQRRLWRQTIEKAVFSNARHADFLWLGIGTVDQPGSFSDHCGAQVIDCLKAKGAVGEIGFMPFSVNGLVYDDLGLGRDVSTNAQNWQQLPDALRAFFNSTFVLKFPDLFSDELAPTLVRQKVHAAQARRAKVVVVAGGELKHDAIWHGLSLLRKPREEKGLGGVDYLVTDLGTVESLYARINKCSRRMAQEIAFDSDVWDELTRRCFDEAKDVHDCLNAALRKHFGISGGPG